MSLPPLDLVQRRSVLVVDDTRESLMLISGLLKDLYRVRIANSGERALEMVRGDDPPDLILLDVMMPQLSGHDVCRMLKDDPATRHIPLIFLTALSDTEEERMGLQLGAADFIVKPVNPPILLARVATHLRVKLATDFLRDKNQFLEAEVQRRGRELTAIQDVTIMAMASLAETRDNETGNHILRTQHYVRVLAGQLRSHPRFSAFLTDHAIELLFKSAPLHDIGKVGVPDRILLKPGRLEPDEFEIMKTHCRLGLEAIEHAEHKLGLEVDFLKFAKEIAFGHQEKWDGSGYPQGLAGDDIPISARLMAVADVYDALISRRVYKEALSHERAAAIISEGRGKHFDPDIVDAFLAVAPQFQAVALQFADGDAELASKAASLAAFKE
ncbi:HD-GYP domain-containing protein [Burkholderiaceae bacterium UC74_6]